jgi:hypothetical protein
MATQKNEFLEKYLPKKNTKTHAKALPQLKIIDPDMEFEKTSSQGEDEIPLLYNPQGLVLSDTQAKTLLKKGLLEADFMENSKKKPGEGLKNLKVF